MSLRITELNKQKLINLLIIIYFYFLGTVRSGLPPLDHPPFSTVLNNRTLNFMEMCSELGSSIVLVPVISVLGNVAIAKAFGKYLNMSACNLCFDVTDWFFVDISVVFCICSICNCDLYSSHYVTWSVILYLYFCYQHCWFSHNTNFLFLKHPNVWERPPLGYQPWETRVFKFFTVTNHDGEYQL